MTDPTSEPTPEGSPLIEHLTELRKRLIRAVTAITIGGIVCYVYSMEIFNYIRQPIERYLPEGGLVFTAPTDKFMAHLKISFFAGLILSCPIWLYQIWKFIAPGLYAREKKYTLGFLFSGTGLFVLGAAFGFYLALPMAFEFLLSFGGSIDKPMITIDDYLSFFLIATFMFGLAFELPLVIVVLGMMGLVSQKFLREKRRYMYVALSILSAILTPGPDLMSMGFMFIPMLILFEVAVFLVGFFERKAATTAPQT